MDSKGHFDVQVVSRLSELSALKEEWKKLHRQASTASPFSSHAWITAWAECYLGNEPARVILVRKDGNLVGIAPFFLRSRFGFRILHLLGLKEVGGESVDFLLFPEMEEELCPIILDALLDVAEPWDALSLYGIRYTSIVHRLAYSRISKFSCQTKRITTPLGFARVVELPGSWEEFLQSRSRNFRRDLKRHKIAWEDARISMRLQSDLGGHDHAVENLIEVESCSWQGKRGKPLISSNEVFFRRILPGLLESGKAEIAWAMKDKDPQASLLILIHKDRAFFYVTGYRASESDLSLGTAVHYFALQHLCGRSIRHVDFMVDIGPGCYKDRWAKNREVVLRDVFVKESFRGRLIALQQAF